MWRRNCKLLWWLRSRRASKPKEEIKVLACEQVGNAHSPSLLRLSLMVPQYSGVAYHFLPHSSRPAVLTCSYSEWIRLLLTPKSLHYIYSKWHLTPFYLLHHTAWAEATILYHLTYFQSLLTSLLSQLSLLLGAQELFLNDKEVARIHRRTVQKRSSWPR